MSLDLASLQPFYGFVFTEWVRVIVPPSLCVLIPLCPRPIVSSSHCAPPPSPVPLCPWTVNNFYDLERKCQISAFLEVLSKRLPVCGVFFPSSETVFNFKLLCVNLYQTSNFYDAFFENVRAPAKLLHARTLSVQLRRFVTVVSVSEDARHTLFLARWRYTGSTADVLELPSVKAKVHRTCFLRWTRKRRVLRTTFRPNSECKVPNSGSAICSTDESVSYYYLCKCDLTAT